MLLLHYKRIVSLTVRSLVKETREAGQGVRGGGGGEIKVVKGVKNDEYGGTVERRVLTRVVIKGSYTGY